ncbi:MAG: tetratricopeptide repeat protein [Kiritimatiellae bacterium]|nr:tetratricopeptide repeat protein [Kiritimatiellia bacterium]
MKKLSTMTLLSRTYFILILTLAASITGSTASGQTARQRLIEEELRYISGLQEWGLIQVANEVMAAAEARYPEIKPQIKVAKLKGLLAVGDFEQVRQIISKEPNQASQDVWAMKLALADGFYAWGKYAEAQGIYEAFFKQYAGQPPAAIQGFYRDSAYKYAQMLILMGNEDKALDAYRRVLKVKNERYIERQVMSELAELLIKVGEKNSTKKGAYFKEAEKLANKILWVQDLWFGKAIVYLAHIEMARGNIQKATKLVDDYKEDLKAIHDTLVEQSKGGYEDLTRLSPIAECRYLLGSIMLDKAEALIKVNKMGNKPAIVELLAGKATGKMDKRGNPGRSAGALQHFLNVFIRFPTTQWAADAGMKARKVEDILIREYEATINTSVSEEQLDRVRSSAFQQARSLFNQQQFEKAVESYIVTLSLFPEGEASISAIAELCQAYLELGEETHADMVVSYLAERFSMQEKLMPAAGDRVVKLAMYCGDRKMPDRRDAIYDMFFENYRKHPRTSGLIYMFGEERFGQEAYDAALTYFTQIEEKYPNAPTYFNAMSRKAYCYSNMKDFTNEVKQLTKLTEELDKKERPGHAYISANFRLAYAYKQLDKKYLSAAYNRYSKLIKTISSKDPRYANSGEEREANQKVLEGAMFYSAICLAQLTPSEDKLPIYRKKAISTLEQLIETFPKSQFAPSALNQIGTLYVLLEEPEKAREALDKLRKDYPKTDEAKNSRFLLAKSLLELGYRQKAVKIFKEMFAGDGQYAAGQILTAGLELLKAGEAEIALQAFNRVLKSEKKRSAVEPAMLGKGNALLALEKHAEAAELFADLLAKFPNSGYTVEACSQLSLSYATLGASEADKDKRFMYFNDAVKAMNRARQFEKNAAGREGLNLGVARIYAQKAVAESKFGTPETEKEARGFAVATYQMMITLADPRDPEVRKHIETAYHECLPLLLAMERWTDAFNDAEQYLSMFERTGRYVSDVRACRTRARTKMMTAGAPTTTQAPTPETESTKTAVTNTATETTTEAKTNAAANQPSE